MIAQRLLSKGCGIGVRKLFLRLGLRGHHPHPPAPSPASGRGGERIINSVALGSGRGGEARAMARAPDQWARGSSDYARLGGGG